MSPACSDGFCGADDCARCHPGWQESPEGNTEHDDDDNVDEDEEPECGLIGWVGSTHSTTD